LAQDFPPTIDTHTSVITRNTASCGLNGLQRGLISVDGVPQKNYAQHRHGIFGGRELGVGTELSGGFPQAGFNLRDVVEGVCGHLCGD
jgi:hypothetical protein